MSQPTSDNTASGTFLLLVLGIQLLGLVILFRGMPIMSWLLSGAAGVFASFAGALLRGLVILALLIVIYLLVAQKFTPIHPKAGAMPVDSDHPRANHEQRH